MTMGKDGENPNSSPPMAFSCSLFSSNSGYDAGNFTYIGCTDDGCWNLSPSITIPPLRWERMEEEGSGAMVYPQYSQIPIRYNHPNRMLESGGASTSGRIGGADALAAQIYRQNIEIDALIRLQNERLRLGLEETRKRHCRALIAAFEQQVIKKLKEKDEELANAMQKNAELEEQIRQIAAENEIWFSVAKNNEEIVATLKASLAQVFVQNQNAVNINGVVKAEEEGYGDSDGMPLRAEDAQSCCFVVGEEERTNGNGNRNGTVKRDVEGSCWLPLILS